MLRYKVAVIGGGISGMEVAKNLSSMGISVSLIEKNDHLGGHIYDWFRLFPDMENPGNILETLVPFVHNNTDLFLSSIIKRSNRTNSGFDLELDRGQHITCDAVIITSGYKLFNAALKEEYGYRIYDNVITSADLEIKLKQGKPLTTSSGKTPQRIAIIHCVGSRDEKVGNTYCSKVCCITGVKQAIELKQLIPGAEIFSFYMDLRMYDRHFEDLFCEAQFKYGIKYFRGRLSEAGENRDGSILLKMVLKACPA